MHGFSLDALARRDLANECNVEVVNGIDELLPALESPRVVWMMVPLKRTSSCSSTNSRPATSWSMAAMPTITTRNGAADCLQRRHRFR